MNISKLPYELQREIYDYDNTYIEKFKSCITELQFLIRTFPIQVDLIIYDQQNFYFSRNVPLHRLKEFREFIYSYCKRKRSLRSYKNYKHFT